MILKTLLEIAFPPVCEGCGDAYFKSGIPGLCQTCYETKLFPSLPPYCKICGQEYFGKMPLAMRCSNCREQYLDFDFAIGAYRNEGEIIDWVRRFKYRNEIHFARMFGKLMNRVWEDQRFSEHKQWVVVPVPLHWKRIRERGFNQSLEIAREFVRHSPPEKDLRIAEVLTRERYTTQQARLSRRERLVNLQGAFTLSRNAEKLCAGSENIMIVDDVLTTGTTASECALVLRNHLSPSRISVITMLRG